MSYISITAGRVTNVSTSLPQSATNMISLSVLVGQQVMIEAVINDEFGNNAVSLVIVLCLGVIKLFGSGCCYNSMREKDWRCRKRGTQAT
jgi:hypothetical protein